MFKKTLWAALAALLAVGGLTAPAHADSPTSPNIVTVKAFKAPPPQVGGFHTSSVIYWYAGGRQQFTGTLPSLIQASTTVRDPYVDPGHHTLMELSAERTNTQGRQIAEVGINKDTALYGGATTQHIFTYSWVNSVGKNYNTGTGAGFTLCTAGTCGAAPNYAPGQVISVGTSLVLKLEHRTAGTNIPFTGWYAYAAPTSGCPAGKTCYMGGWPDTNWTGASPATTFTDIDTGQAFGEVALITPSMDGPCDDMGSGDYGSSTPSPETRAFFGSWTTNYTSNALTIFTPSGYYDAVLASGSVRTMYLGGPGSDWMGTMQGTKGSC